MRRSSSSTFFSAIFSSRPSCCCSCSCSLYCCRTDARVEAAFAISACAAVSSSLISFLSLRAFSFFAASSLPRRCAAMSPVKSPWHRLSINLAIDRTRDIWNMNRFWSEPFMHLRVLAMSKSENKLAPRVMIGLSARFHTQSGSYGPRKNCRAPAAGASWYGVGPP